MLQDTHGARYGVMTTNLAETYNFVLRGNRALPLTAIVEGIFQGTVKYFRDRCQRAHLHIVNNPNTPYCEKIMKYMDDKMGKLGITSSSPSEIKKEGSRCAYLPTSLGVEMR